MVDLQLTTSIFNHFTRKCEGDPFVTFVFVCNRNWTKTSHNELMKETNSVNEKKLKPPEIEAIVKKNNRKLTGY